MDKLNPARKARIYGRAERPSVPFISGRPTDAAGLTRTRTIRLSPIGLSGRANLLDLLRQIRDYNPDAAKAISNMLRLVGTEVHVFAVAEDGETPVDEGQAVLDQITRPEPPMIGVEYGGGLSVLVDMAVLTLSTQGALAMEVELNDLRGPEPLSDILVVNPWVIDFEKDDNRRWRPGIRGAAGFTPLHPIQFRYFPMDPEPDDPRGRSGFLAVLDIIFFQMEVLRDLKQAVHFAGYPRVDISVAYEAVLNAVKQTRPDLLTPGKEGDLRAELDGYLTDITDLIDDLETDDAFIHFDNIKGEYIVPRGTMVNLSELIATIDTQVIAGLKQLPVMMGRNVGSTETHATVQWQVFAEELRNIQAIVGKGLEWALSLVLRVYGIQARAKVEFEPIRSITRKADLEAEKLETEIANQHVSYGWITDDEAALRVVGHKPTGERAPVPTFGLSPASDTGSDDSEDTSEEDQQNAVRAMARSVPDSKYHEEGLLEAGRLLGNVSRLPEWMQARYAWAETRIGNLMANQGARSFDALVDLEDAERIQDLSIPEPVSMETPKQNGHGRKKDK